MSEQIKQIISDSIAVKQQLLNDKATIKRLNEVTNIIVEAFKAAKEKGMITVGFTGETGGKLKELSDHLFNVPSTVTPRIQESHIMLGHIICQLVEERYFATHS